MEFTQGSLISLSGFVALSVLMLHFHFWILSKIFPPAPYLKLYAGVLILTLILSLGGVAARAYFPIAPIYMAIILVTGLGFAYSSGGKQVASISPLTLLIGFQAVRLPLELILHEWAGSGTVPETMTWTGSNWDIIAGIVSLVSVPFINRSRVLAWAVQIIGCVLLLNVLRVVIMSSPFPISWPLTNPLVLIAHFPYALIVPVFVLPAFVAHLLTFRKLLGKV